MHRILSVFAAVFLLRAMCAVAQGAAPERIEVLEAYAQAAMARRDFIGALAAYQAILARDPTHRGALLGKIRALSRAGSPQLALELADRNPELLERSEYDAIAADRTAARIQGGSVAADLGTGARRFADLDRALAESDSAGRKALERGTVLSAAERQLALDRVVALRDRYRAREAVALFEALAGRGEVPAYAKSAAAYAYLTLRQPEKARSLFEEAASVEPRSTDAQLGLFYALVDLERHAAAREHIDRLAAVTPQWIDAWSPQTIRENPAYARVLTAQATAPLFANRPGEAEARLHALSDRAPFNMDVRVNRAGALRSRGWPRAAVEELDWVLAAEPEHVGALAERSGALRDMRDYRGSRAALARASALAAEDSGVVREQRGAQVHDSPELTVEGGLGESNGGPTGNRDQMLEAFVYSSPLHDRYRVFGHLYQSRAKFADGIGRRESAGVGGQYRSPNWVASGELSGSLNGGESALSGSLAFTPDDRWSVRGEAESSSYQTPLQARRAGVRARRAATELAWRAHESRALAVSYARMHFTDGNDRDIVQGRWTERLVARAAYTLEATGGAYASRNSLPDAAYFNPRSDFSPTLELANEWLQSRRYERALRHRVVATVGTYRQEGFGTGKAAGLRYEQDWQLSARAGLRYGVGRSLHPYDGVQTARNYAFFALNWKL